MVGVLMYQSKYNTNGRNRGGGNTRTKIITYLNMFNSFKFGNIREGI